LLFAVGKAVVDVDIAVHVDVEVIVIIIQQHFIIGVIVNAFLGEAGGHLGGA